MSHSFIVPVISTPDIFTDDISTTGLLTPGSYSTGTIEMLGDRDWFAVNLTGGTTYRVDVETDYDGPNRGLGNTSLIGIYDSSGTFVSNTAREGGGDFLNARGFFTPASSGTYYVSTGSKDDSGAPSRTTGDYKVRVTDNWDDYAADTSTTGTLSGGARNGFFGRGVSDWAGDADWFAVNLVAGQKYDAIVNGWNGYLHGVYDASGTYIANTRDDDSGKGSGALSTFTATTGGTYYVSAGLSPSGSGRGEYQILVRENNDDYSQDASNPGMVTVGGSVSGILTNYEDRDWFGVDLVAGEDYTVIVELGGGLAWSAIHSIRTADGVRLPGVSDRSGSWWTSDTAAIVSFQATETGTYYIDVSGGVFYRARDGGEYTVSVITGDIADDATTTARVAVDGSLRGTIDYRSDSDWIGVDLEAGETYIISMRGADSGAGSLVDPYLYSIRDAAGVHVARSSDDDSGTGANAQVQFTATATGTYYIDARRAADNSATGSTYRVAVDRVVDDYAGDISTTGTLAPGADATGTIDAIGDTDWFAATLTGGTEYRIDVLGEATSDGTLSRPLLAGVSAQDGTQVPYTVVAGGGEGLNTSFVFTPVTDGTYFVAAGGHLNTSGSYTLRLTERVELTGTSGDDWLNPASLMGAELSGISGGNGTDTANFDGAGARVIVDLHADRAILGPDILALESIENATGTQFDDSFIGSDRAETFRGLGGDDMFYGSDGGADVYDGGSGRDTVTYAGASLGVEASLLRGRGSQGYAEDDVFRWIENLTGTSQNDTLTGDHGANRLVGGAGDDLIIGNGGDDYILAGFGTDTIVFRGDRAEYTITRDGIRTIVEHTGGSGLDGTDILGHAEILQFADGDLIL